MTGNGGFLVALATATGVHVAALEWFGPLGNADSAGGGGAEPLSIALAGASVAALVETWETAPEPAQTPQALEAPRELTDAAVAVTQDVPVRTASVQPLLQVDVTAAPSVAPTETHLASPAPETAPRAPDATRAPKSHTIAALQPPTRAMTPTMDTVAPAVPDFAVTASLRPTPRIAPAVKTRAAGKGQSATAGTGTTEAPRAAASEQAQASAQAAWAAAIQRKVARAQVYPRGGRGDGRVRLAMTITANGALTGVRVVQSSGVSAFDKAALRAAKRAAPFPKAPEVLTEARFAFGQWVTFER